MMIIETLVSLAPIAAGAYFVYKSHNSIAEYLPQKSEFEVPSYLDENRLEGVSDLAKIIILSLEENPKDWEDHNSTTIYNSKLKIKVNTAAYKHIFPIDIERSNGIFENVDFSDYDKSYIRKAVQKRTKKLEQDRINDLTEIVARRVVEPDSVLERPRLGYCGEDAGVPLDTAVLAKEIDIRYRSYKSESTVRPVSKNTYKELYQR